MEYNIYDNLCTYGFVEALDQALARHLQVLPERGRGEVDVQRLVLDIHLPRVAGNGFAEHRLPSLDEAVLVERSFEALLAEKLANEVAYGFGVGAAHVV